MNSDSAVAVEETPVENNSCNNSIKIASKKQFPGDSIGSLASSFYYTHEDTKVEDIALDMEKNPHIFILGTVNNENKCTGIVTKREFFDKLGTRFGRALFNRHKISSMTMEVQDFKAKKNIFNIADKIKEELSQSSNLYYILKNDDGTFYGIFSSKDMLVYLSSITRKEMDMAEKIQFNIIKNSMFVEDDKYSAVGYSKMAQGIGGDYYNIFKYDTDRCLFVLCDVSGKGISASIVTGIIGGMFNTLNIKAGLQKFLRKMNSYIYNTFKLEKYITSVIFRLNAKEGKLKIIDLGHCMGEGNLYLIRDEKFYKIKNRNYSIPVGLEPDIEIKSDVLKLKNGDRIFVCSDGLHDQFNELGEGYDYEKLEKLVMSNSDKDLLDLKNLIVDDIKNFRNGQPAFDDMTFIIIDYKG